MSILCVIPVRGGSRGLPGKNIRMLGGYPLVAWTIQAALEAEADLHVVVSTDSEEIAEVARRYGADVPGLRPAELARDETPTEPVVEHALAAERAAGVEPEAVMLLQATSPLRLPGTLDRAVAALREPGVDAVVGVVPVSPFLWRHAEDPADAPLADYDVTARKRRQDMARTDLRYRENGSLYVTRPWVYDELHNRLGGRIALLELDDLEGVDIDTELDFALAEQQMDQYLAVHKVLRHRSDLGAPRTAETPTTGPNRTPGGAQ
ncbi:cytidylyltransferase domain-containing protein [Micrococcus luteus]|uniref:acylneuraminate cytidylyltransferase family protein n=1 Tax=Micrococcus luteus TaxID=1270 RepID=UPI003EBB9A03